MAFADYYHCDNCDRKAFYDADIDWDIWEGIDMKVLCNQCTKEYEVVIKEKNNNE